MAKAIPTPIPIANTSKKENFQRRTNKRGASQGIIVEPMRCKTAIEGSAKVPNKPRAKTIAKILVSLTRRGRSTPHNSPMGITASMRPSKKAVSPITTIKTPIATHPAFLIGTPRSSTWTAMRYSTTGKADLNCSPRRGKIYDPIKELRCAKGRLRRFAFVEKNSLVIFFRLYQNNRKKIKIFLINYRYCEEFLNFSSYPL